MATCGIEYIKWQLQARAGRGEEWAAECLQWLDTQAIICNEINAELRVVRTALSYEKQRADEAEKQHGATWDLAEEAVNWVHPYLQTGQLLQERLAACRLGATSEAASRRSPSGEEVANQRQSDARVVSRADAAGTLKVAPSRKVSE